MTKYLVSYLVNGQTNNSMSFDFLMPKQTTEEEVIIEAKKRAALRERKGVGDITLNPIQSIDL